MATLFQDLRYALRMLARDRAFTAMAVLTLALGIGANTAIFTLVNAFLFRPLPFADPSRLVWISNPNPGDGGIPGLTGTANFRDWREFNQSFEIFAAFLPSFSDRTSATLTGAGEPSRLKAAFVTASFLQTLGVQPQLGRNFSEEESRRNSPRALILADSLWRRQFQSDPAIVGRAITINNESWSVIGVLPSIFDFSTVFGTGAEAVDFLRPYQDGRGLDNWGNLMAVVARLKPAVSISMAQTEFDRLNRQLEKSHPERGRIDARLTPLRTKISGPFTRPFLILAVAAGCVLLIACVNLSNLLLARGAVRRKEIAVRAALGAGRWRLVRQMLTESALLAACGGALGLILAAFAVRIVRESDTFNIPLLQTASVDGQAATFTLLAAFSTTLLFGVIPALQLSRRGVQDDLKENSRGSGFGRRFAWMRQALVVSEVALACVLLVGTGLLTRSFFQLLDLDPGFNPEQASAWRIQPNREFAGNAQESEFYQELSRRINHLPGVASVTFPDKLPLELNDVMKVRAQGAVYERNKIPGVLMGMVDHAYLKTMGIPLRAGRDFESSDPAFDWHSPGSKVAIVNEKLARDFWPGQSPLGRVVYIDGPPDPSAECRIVGVAGNVRQSALESEVAPEIFVVGGGRNLVVRTKGPLTNLIPLVNATLRQMAPEMAVERARPLRRIIDRAVAPRRLIAVLLGAFSGLALLLAAVGIYGVIAYSVSQRTREIGIRLAFGSPRHAVARLIIGEGMWVVSIGCAAGLAGSLALTRLMQALLFAVSPSDPLTYVVSGLLLVAVALLACWLPARRATLLDPMTALRQD